MQASFEQALERRLAAPADYPQDRFEGRGIVICAGGQRYFTCAWVLISVLRKVHRCPLPIQIWHLGRAEMSEEMGTLLAEHGVEVVDAETVLARYPARVAGGWPLKPYAIMQSRFREVLYLDADTVPLVDPQAAFGWNEYRDTGLVLWPDVVDITAANPIWARLGLKSEERMSIDSGILVVDKAKAWNLLDLAVVMNEYCEEVYDLLYGDKDTFLISALLRNQPFGLIPHRPFQLEWDLVQRDPGGEPFVHHRTGSKWLLHQPNRALANSSLMPACEAALAQLRQRWSGIVFHPPERSSAAQAEEARLVALRTFRYQTGPDDVRDLELLPGGRIGKGAALERNWAVIEQDGRLVLQLFAGHAPWVRLAKASAGAWRGTDGAPGSEILLHEPDSNLLPSGEHERQVRSADRLLDDLLGPALYAVGFDAKRAVALEAALSLLNEIYDDVPEQVGRRIAEGRIPQPWRRGLDQLARNLTVGRARRMPQSRPSKFARVLNPAHYARPMDV